MTRYARYTGEKVYLTALTLDDAEAITKWYNDPDVAYYMDEHREVKSLLTVREEVAEMTKSGAAFAIFDKENDILIGYSKCGSSFEFLIGEKNYWHKGYDIEALGFLMDFDFNIRNRNIITVCAYSHDERALACYEEAGFKKVLTYRERMLRGREKFDLIFMDMLASEYFEMQRGLCNEL